ncbi:MAG: spermidine synthase [Verrucomicrobiota bacterium]
MNFTVHAILVFLGAFLLFLIQPIFAKLILPWFGGVAGVWAVCLVFFQGVLLLGYLYCHFFQYCNRRAQVVIHFCVLVAIGISCPFLFHSIPKPAPSAEPMAAILEILIRYLGAPFFLLSTTSVLVQIWQTRDRKTHRTPYELYVFSNIGSLLALLIYPFFIEPFVGLKNQLLGWTVAFIVYLAFYGSATFGAYASNKKVPQFIPPRWKGASRAFLLAGLGSAVLVSFTTHLCIDVAPMPFLWVLPLALYLLSFVFCFAKKPIYRREIWIPLMLFFLLAAITPLGFIFFILSAGLLLVALFFVFMVVHGEMVLTKPPPQQLSLFYITICAGSVVGSSLMSLLAPWVFNAYFETPLLIATLFTMGTCLLAFHTKSIFSWDKNWKIASLLVLVTITLFAVGVIQYFRWDEDILCRARNFYGAIYVRTYKEYRVLMNGHIIHGASFNDFQRAMKEPIAYYSPGNGAQIVWDQLKKDRPKMKIGVIGLGAGIFASYARQGDDLVFYEINPADVNMARQQFPFLNLTPANVKVVLGDARLSMENQEAQNYDLLIFDAFNSDAIPVHLLTLEAFQLYLRHLKPDGFLLLHISNIHLDLKKPIVGAASQLKLHCAFIQHRPDSSAEYLCSSHHAILARQPFDWDPRDGAHNYNVPDFLHDASSPWTDQYSTLLPLLKGPSFGKFWSKILLQFNTLKTLHNIRVSMKKNRNQWDQWQKEQKANIEAWDKAWERDKRLMEQELKKNLNSQ